MILLDTNVVSEPLKASGDADVLATLRARARSAGLSIAPADGYIAAIAATHGFAIASRDTSPFDAAGLTVINPWTWQAR